MVSCLCARKNLDNLTHSLAGAVLGQMGLKKNTGLGMATLIIAANIPDIDAVATLLDGVQHLAIRRGITHGPIAMLLLPLVLTGIMIWFDRWQEKRGKRPADRLPIHRGWLLALAYIGCLSHPALDWLNSYGIRLLEPFSSRWFYGDSIFIIDIWIWAVLIAGVWVSRRREKKGFDNWRNPAILSAIISLAYIAANLAISQYAVARATVAYDMRDGRPPEFVVPNPVPVAFWQREMLAYIEDEVGRSYYQRSDFNLFKPLSLPSENVPVVYAGFGPPPFDLLAPKNRDLRALLFWARMPVIDTSPARFKNCGYEVSKVSIGDFRFSNSPVDSRFRAVGYSPSFEVCE